MESEKIRWSIAGRWTPQESLCRLLPQGMRNMWHNSPLETTWQ